ncbi:EAL domain-containing protein [Provencibacterium massiliense]|uniref:EAL domain-containing protein n=1 Tax=Provencibacterium massiliense TaxID=1841868 RepID=UPI0009A883A7|nr:EAL domain-containing protein [Provencibacterium massiliense]
MPQKLILVVEDNQINRTVLSGILFAEYRILEAENGQEALSLLKEHKDEISLILLDIIMPVMDGYTFLSIIKADPAYSGIPVIVTTQSGSESDEVTALSYGANDFVAKPYKPQIILHRVASLINLRETAAMINQFQYDRLTGLYSKEFFYQRVKETLQQSPEREFDIVCSDIENFKLVNDIFGVPAGDRLLCGVADLYTKFVSGKGICGRFGADHFACLLERHWEYNDKLFVEANALINALPNAKNVVVKWGIYNIVDRTVPVEQMCDRALLAARSIKGQYGKYFATYDDELRGKLLREQAITEGMEAALAQEQFVVYLQPKYSIKDGGLAGAEALVRWNHPQWGFQHPGEFIPLFERNGFITRLDQYVWEKVCAMLREWEEKGYEPLPVSVNVSRADVYQADLPDILIHLIQKYKLPPSRLHLEITESAYTENPGQIIATVNRLRELGFVIEMDDFGSGYSSLNMLNKMPLDILKLDMNFIQSETAKPADQGILRFIMDLARWMNLSVVAEGVETKTQLERLREIGGDYVQGYYFARPMPKAEFEVLLLEAAKASKEKAPHRAKLRAQQRPLLLVADEEESYRVQVQQTFGSRYQVVGAPDGASALAALDGNEHRVAAVVLSLTLPDCAGFNVLDQLVGMRDIWNIPVIATSPPSEQLEERALELGADDFVCKPYSQKSLWRRVMRTVGIRSSAQRERALEKEAYRDYLTGLLNRRGLSAACDPIREEDLPVAVYLFDLDNLKQINDTLGHLEGDGLIQRFGALLSRHTRKSDLLARYGGDEFIVVMQRMGDEQAALAKGEEICRVFRESCRTDRVPAACSAGIAVCRAQEPLADVIARADEALYRAKSDNKGGCCLWKG